MSEITEFDALRKLLAANVRMYRRAKKLSQEELAFEAEIDRTYVSQIERSIINPSLLILFRVSQALGVNVQDLLDTESENGSSSLGAPRVQR